MRACHGCAAEGLDSQLGDLAQQLAVANGRAEAAFAELSEVKLKLATAQEMLISSSSLQARYDAAQATAARLERELAQARQDLAAAEAQTAELLDANSVLESQLATEVGRVEEGAREAAQLRAGMEQAREAAARMEAQMAAAHQVGGRLQGHWMYGPACVYDMYSAIPNTLLAITCDHVMVNIPHPAW